jgi:hypothetical protein
MWRRVECSPVLAGIIALLFFAAADASDASAAAIQIVTRADVELSAAETQMRTDGGTGTVQVTAGDGCAWTAASNVPWIAITAGASGTGRGSVQYSVAGNSSGATRTGTVTIAGNTFTVSQAGSGTTPLTSDWVPCGPPGGAVGGPGEDVEQPSRTRVLITRSRDGLHFERPSTDAERFLVDGADVPDAVVLPSGRVLVYFMAGCRDYAPSGGSKTTKDAIAVAVSDAGGAAGSWVFKDVSFDNAAHGLDRPFDPNIVLWKPEQNLLRIFVSQAAGGPSIATHSYTSSDGFTFTYEGKRYDPGPPDGIVDPENFRFDDTHWYIICGVPEGFATSSDDGATFTGQRGFSDHVTNVTGYGGIPNEVAVTNTPGMYRVFAGASRATTGMAGIDSLRSTASPWTSWEWEGPVLDVAGGIESCEVRFPTVVRLAADDWLMFYGTTIPNCDCGGDGMLFHCSPPTSVLACYAFTISPTSASLTASAGSQQVAVTGWPSGCSGGSWSASGNGSWLTVSPSSGSGSGSVTVSWEANTGSAQRTGDATIGGQTFTVTQAASSAKPHTVRRHVLSTAEACPGQLSSLGVLRSTDRGATWVSLGNACMQGSPVWPVDPTGMVVDGKVVLYVVDFGHLNQPVPQTIYRTTSGGGVNFTAPQPAYTQTATMVDPGAVRLAGGLYRIYVPSEGEGTISATSTDGLAFTRDSGVRATNGGMPGALLLPDNRVRLFLNGAKAGQQGIFSMISADGLAFMDEGGLRIPSPAEGMVADDAQPIRLADGTYLMLYQLHDAKYEGKGLDPWTFTELHLATSTDGLNWTPDSRIIGYGGTSCVVEMPDGARYIYYVNR